MKTQVLTTPQWNKARMRAIQQFMPSELRPHRNLAVGKRLVLARTAMGMARAQGKFAQLAGIGATVYNQWESGENYPGLDNAIRLCQRHTGITLDWIYMGKLDGMPTWLTNAIQSLLAAEDAQPPPAAQAPQPPDVKIVKVPRGRHLNVVKPAGKTPAKRDHSA